MIELFGLVIIVGLIWLVVSVSKGQATAETKLDLKETENEVIKENIKAAKVVEADINKLDDVAVKQLLAKKWTRK